MPSSVSLKDFFFTGVGVALVLAAAALLSAAGAERAGPAPAPLLAASASSNASVTKRTMFTAPDLICKFVKMMRELSASGHRKKTFAIPVGTAVVQICSSTTQLP